jgi:hypothetical protein
MAAFANCSTQADPIKSIEKALLNMKGDPIPEKNIKSIRKMIALFFMNHVFPNGAEVEFKD